MSQNYDIYQCLSFVIPEKLEYPNLIPKDFLKVSSSTILNILLLLLNIFIFLSLIINPNLSLNKIISFIAKKYNIDLQPLRRLLKFDIFFGNMQLIICLFLLLLICRILDQYDVYFSYTQ